MKKLGIVGGIGPESTIAYYRLIFEIYAQQAANGRAPSLVIESVDVRKLIAWMESGNLTAVTDYLAKAIATLEAAGADFALLSANSPHLVFDDLVRTCRIPLLSIVEATCDYATARGLRKVGLLGTRFTVQARFFPDVFARSQITIVVPSAEEQQYLHEKYINELLNGVFLPETRDNIVSLIAKMRERDAIEGVILGGTELPLLLDHKELGGLPLLDTTEIHVRAAVQQMLES